MENTLRKILIQIEEIEEVPYISELFRELEKENIQYEIWKMVGREETLQEMASICEKEVANQGILWITDSQTFGALLRTLGQAVLLYENPNKKSSKNLMESTDGEPYFPYVILSFENLEPEYLERVYRRFFHIPWNILETKRLLVRESSLEDLPFFYQIYKDKEITQYMEGLFEDSEEEKKYLQAYIDTAYRFYETGIYTVVLKENQEIIGRAGLERRDGFEELELGFVIGLKHQKKGYATEVCEALLQYAKEYFPEDRIHALVEKENQVSIHLLEKLGFVRGKFLEIDTAKNMKKKYLEMKRISGV